MSPNFQNDKAWCGQDKELAEFVRPENQPAKNAHECKKNPLPKKGVLLVKQA